MEELALYLFRSALWITGFTFVWVVLLRNENFFHLKRIYLIAGILASFFFPLITIRYSIEIPMEGVIPVYSVNSELHEATFPEPEKKISLLPLYLVGSILLTFRLIWHACRLFKKILAAAPDERAEKVIRSSNHSSPFSFFGYIFVNPEIPAGCMEEIMNHEKAHIRQKHWIDLLLAEFLCILQWFNPIVWIYKSYLRQNHEYLADREALRVSADPVLYRQTLFNQLLGSPVFALTNPFTESSSKKRFDMMKKTSVNPIRRLRLLPLFPVIALIFWFCSEQDYDLITVEGSEQPTGHASLQNNIRVNGLVFGDNDPIGGVQVFISGSATRTVTDKEGYFELDAPAGSSITFLAHEFSPTSMQIPWRESYEPLMVAVRLYKDGQPRRVPNTYPYRVLSIQHPFPSLLVIDGLVIEKSLPGYYRNMPAAANIENITLLRGESVVSEYGERARNGAIIITTKK